jgi:IS5 family transposase
MVRKTNGNYQLSFLQADLLEQLDAKHPLLMLANEIPWAYLEKELRTLYLSAGRPAKPVRSMCGLMILKQMNQPHL